MVSGTLSGMSTANVEHVFYEFLEYLNELEEFLNGNHMMFLVQMHI